MDVWEVPLVVGVGIDTMMLLCCVLYVFLLILLCCVGLVIELWEGQLRASAVVAAERIMDIIRHRQQQQQQATTRKDKTSPNITVTAKDPSNSNTTMDPQAQAQAKPIPKKSSAASVGEIQTLLLGNYLWRIGKLPEIRKKARHYSQHTNFY